MNDIVCAFCQDRIVETVTYYDPANNLNLHCGDNFEGLHEGYYPIVGHAFHRMKEDILQGELASDYPNFERSRRLIKGLAEGYRPCERFYRLLKERETGVSPYLERGDVNG